MSRSNKRLADNSAIKYFVAAATGIILLSHNAAAQSTTTTNTTAELIHMRQMLTGARLTVTDTLQKTGSVPPEQLSVINETIKDAINTWSVCVINEVDNHSSYKMASTDLVDAAMTNCKQDRDEVIAWIRLAGEAHGEQMPASLLDDFVRKQEAAQRSAALERLTKERGAN